MKNYGLELEFFVKNEEGTFVPAYKFTNNLDGSPVVGELRTGVHSSITDAVFEMKKLIFCEKQALGQKNCELVIIPEVNFDKNILEQLRSDVDYVNNKNKEVLELKSIYGKSTGKFLTRTLYKASLQINISENTYFSYKKYSKKNSGEYDYEFSTFYYSEPFDYISIIRKLDDIYKKEIRAAKRVPGVFSIKNGEKGKRIEYRSLPNTIELLSLINNI